jgi:AraC family transcriptional regulator
MIPRRLERGSYLGATVKQRSTAGLLLTLTSYEAGRHWDLHVHEHPGFFFLLAGQHREERPHWVTEQEVVSAIFHGTSDVHSTEVGPKGMTGLNISFHNSWLASLGVKQGELQAIDCQTRDVQHFAALRVLSLGLDTTVPAWEVESVALDLLVPLTRGDEPRVPKWLSRARHSLIDRFDENISLSTLAIEAAVHPNYLARAFRRHFGCSVHEYLHRVRLTEAMRRIQEGDSLGEAAIESGFSDQAHFTRIARRQLGKPPGLMKSMISPATALE